MPHFECGAFNHSATSPQTGHRTHPGLTEAALAWARDGDKSAARGVAQVDNGVRLASTGRRERSSDFRASVRPCCRSGSRPDAVRLRARPRGRVRCRDGRPPPGGGLCDLSCGRGRRSAVRPAPVARLLRSMRFSGFRGCGRAAAAVRACRGQQGHGGHGCGRALACLGAPANATPAAGPSCGVS